jgi:hypothetical protein
VKCRGRALQTQEFCNVEVSSHYLPLHNTTRNIIALFFIDTKAGTDVSWLNAPRMSGRA